jgi:hypothetical protein
MLAILAAVLFAIALILDLADATSSIGASELLTAGLLCLALHLAGIGARTPARNGGGKRWSFRR